MLWVLQRHWADVSCCCCRKGQPHSPGPGLLLLGLVHPCWCVSDPTVSSLGAQPGYCHVKLAPISVQGTRSAGLGWGAAQTPPFTEGPHSEIDFSWSQTLMLKYSCASPGHPFIHRAIPVIRSAPAQPLFRCQVFGRDHSNAGHDLGDRSVAVWVSMPPVHWGSKHKDACLKF